MDRRTIFDYIRDNAITPDDVDLHSKIMKFIADEDKYDSSNVLLYAASKSLKKEKRFEDAKSIKCVLNCPNSTNKSTGLSAEKALTIIIDANLSKSNYQHLRNIALECNCDCFACPQQL